MKKVLLCICFGLGGLLAQNNALDFDGSDDYVGCGTSLSVSGDLTVSAWVKSSGVQGGNDYIVAKGNDNGISGSFGIGLVGEINTHAMFMFYDTADNVDWAYSDSGTIETDTWYHIAGVISGSTAYIYINGALAGQETITGSISATTLNLNIGKQDRSGYEYFFHGLIDEVQIWNTALSMAQIRQYMYQELNGDETNLAAYYKFNASSGTTLDDLTSNNNDGTLTNMSDDDWVTSSAFFGPKNCLDFDGVDDYVSIPDNSAHEPSSLTLEAWVMVNGDGTTKNGENDIQFICFKKNSRDDNFEGYVIYYSENGNGFKGGVTSSSGDQVLVTTPDDAINFSTWYHVALVADNTDLTLYLNGISQGTTATGFGLDYGTWPLYFGRTGSGSWDGLFNGKLDEVRIWNTKRTVTQIRENMCKTLAGSESGLVAYYNFDNSSGTTLQDLSSNSNDGTLTSMDESTDWVSSSAFNTWLNTSSTTWSTSSNWSNGVPLSGANVGIFNYTNEPTISGSPTFGNLYLGSGISTTLSSGMTVNGSLILDKDFDLNGQTITLGSSGTLIENSGRLYGSSGTITSTRSLDNIDENVAGLGAEITTSANMGSTTITRSHAAPGSQAIERKYYINPITNTGLNATLVFHYNDNELNGQTEANLELFKSSDGSTWTEQSSSTINTTDNTITLTGIDAFSYWTAAPTGSDASLPVELTAFTAECRNGGVLLKWTTESETENLGFILEKRLQVSGDWLQVADYRSDESLQGCGSSSERHDYQFTDKAVVSGATYLYRLADVDYSGKVTWHNAIEVKVEGVELQIPVQFGLQRAYPNPFNPSLTIPYGLVEDGHMTLKVYNLRGELVEVLISIYTLKGTYSYTWQPQNLSSGVYVVRLQSGDQTNLQKIVFVK